MEKKSVNVNFNIGGTLAIIFIVLKVLNLITWSWIWVLSPIWISIVLIFLSAAVLVAIELKK